MIKLENIPTYFVPWQDTLFINILTFQILKIN